MGDYSIFVGTVGQGLNISSDSGESWTKIRNPIPTEGNVRALATYPGNPTASSLVPTASASSAATTTAFRGTA